MNDFYDDDFFDDGLDPDELDEIQDEYDEGLIEEDEDSELNQDENNVEPREEYFEFDPFWLGVAAGFGYEMGQEERRRKKWKK